MSPDDLEARLERWQPADPPPDLLRRLRAAEPPVRAGYPWRNALDRLAGMVRPWSLASAGLVAALMLFSSEWVFSPLRHASSTSDARIVRGVPAPTTHSTTGGGFRAWDHPGGLNLGSAVLASMEAEPVVVFDLETPIGPMRLNYGYPLSGNGLGNPTFDKIKLDVNRSF